MPTRCKLSAARLALGAALLVPSLSVAAEPEEPPKLLGRCTRAQLSAEPYAEWFDRGYAGYSPNREVLAALAKTDRRDLDLEVFFGTWCGDSRRELPHLLKLLDGLGFPGDRVELIGVDSVEAMLKRSPGGEERGREIWRVPTIVVRRGGREIARIVEHPVLSLERDLLAILEHRAYEPSYPSFPLVRQWLEEGLLADANVSPWGLAGAVRHLVSGEGELSAAARVLLERGDVNEAVKLYQVNCAIFRESAGCQSRLAEALLRAGDGKRATEAASAALRLDPDAEGVKTLVALIEKSAGTKPPTPVPIP